MESFETRPAHVPLMTEKNEEEASYVAMPAEAAPASPFYARRSIWLFGAALLVVGVASVAIVEVSKGHDGGHSSDNSNSNSAVVGSDDFWRSVASCDARSIIANHEGKRSCVYIDTMGHPTVGIGYNLDNPGAPQAIAAVGANYADVRSGKQCLTDSQIMKLFEPSYQSAVAGARRAVSCYDKLCCNVQNVMTDMDYNLGDGGFASFTGFIGYVCRGEWAQAAADGKGTAWCGQVGRRCTEDMAAVASGCSGPGPSPGPPTPPSPPSPTPPSPSPSSGCKSCVEYAGGKACLDRCQHCGSACTSCISGGGGKACASRCCD